ncbi:MAG TPA: hypothetical protein VFD15_05520, partial [Clostridia bacterium]|nr:hypothetical protein [Clostridia bacterium]
GPQIARELLEVDIDTGEIGISGYAGKPTLSRSNRKYQHLFINGRPVKNLAISYAVESAYGELVPRGRYPVYIISLQLPAEKIDANVHPAKLEVRLQDEREIFGVIKNAVRRAVMGRETVSQMVLAKKSMNIGGPKVGKLSFDDPDSHFGKIEEDSTQYANIPYKETWLEPLAQLKNLYILASGPEGLYIVDQHAAHERVLYEQILDKMKKGSYASQMLATPLTLDLSKGQTEMLYKHIIIFREAGFIIEEFGEQSILIRGMPDIGKNFNPENVIMDILDYIENNGGDVDKTTFLKETVSSMACTDAIKDGDSIYSDSMRGLLEDLLSCENPYSCPHGRPTMFNITYKEINKKLQRR